MKSSEIDSDTDTDTDTHMTLALRSSNFCGLDMGEKSENDTDTDTHMTLAQAFKLADLDIGNKLKVILILILT